MPHILEAVPAFPNLTQAPAAEQLRPLDTDQIITVTTLGSVGLQEVQFDASVFAPRAEEEPRPALPQRKPGEQAPPPPAEPAPARRPGTPNQPIRPSRGRPGGR